MDILISRRNLIKVGGALVASTAPIPCFGSVSKNLDKKISLHNIHTGEYLKTTFVENGEVIPEVMKQIELFLRDHRNNKTHTIDPNLIHLINQLQLDCSRPGLTSFDVVSGYRSTETNNMLRQKSKGVAKNSYHTKGCAIDIKLPGHTKELRNLARSYQKGGVGYYPKSGFVHVDVRPKPAYWGPA